MAGVGQKVKATTTAATSVTTGAVTTTQGSTFTLSFVTRSAGGGTFVSIGDNKGNVYTEIGTEQISTGGFMFERQYRCEGGNGGAGHTFNVVMSATQEITLIMQEVTTSAGFTARLDKFVQVLDNTSPYNSGPAATTTVANELLLGWMAGDSGNGAATHAVNNSNPAAGSWTIQTEETDGSTLWTAALATAPVVATGAYDIGFTEVGGVEGALRISTFMDVANSSQPTFKNSIGPGVQAGKGPRGQFSLPPRGLVTPNTDVTVALTGVSATGQVGSVTPSISGLLQSTLSQMNAGPGNRGPFNNVQFLGVKRGTVSNTDVTVALTGVAATGAVGTLGVQHDQPLTGVAGTSAVGTVGVQHDQPLTGVAGTSAAGSVVPSTSAGVTGVAGTSAAGNVTPSTTIGLTGVAGTGSVGNVTASGGDGGNVTVALTGVSATSATGNLTPSTNVPVTGVAGAAAAGSVTPSTSVALTGVSAASAVGTVSATGGDVTVALTGVSATASAGSVTAVGGDAVVLQPQTGTGGGGGSHRGSSPEEIKRKRLADERLEAELRALYRKVALGESPELAQRVEAIIAPITPIKKPPAKRTERIERQARALQLEKVSIDTQIALRLAEKEYEEKLLQEENMRRIQMILQVI